MRILLDTNILVDEEVIHPGHQLLVSSLSWAELGFGIQKAGGPEERFARQLRLRRLQSALGEGLPFDDAAAGAYSTICSFVLGMGARPPGPNGGPYDRGYRRDQQRSGPDPQPRRLCGHRLTGPHSDSLESRPLGRVSFEAAPNPPSGGSHRPRRALLGPDHPDTLASRGDLAKLYYSAGQFADAIPLLKATQTESEQILGPEHRLTLSCRNNLATAYKAVGELTHAIILLEATLTVCERVLGPDTLSSRNNLAEASYADGDPGRAIPYSKGHPHRQ
ncbi:MAG: tetratricopeptide repeat protein [Candidatus Nanopelagicales bacterium]